MYKALNKLHSENGHAGLAILGFPSREFGGQEFKTGPEIANFVKGKGVEFQMMELSKVNPGSGQNPVYNFLMSQTSKSEINWNFSTTFLVGRDGCVAYRIDKNWDLVEEKVLELLAAEVPAQAADVTEVSTAKSGTKTDATAPVIAPVPGQQQEQVPGEATAAL